MFLGLLRSLGLDARSREHRRQAKHFWPGAKYSFRTRRRQARPDTAPGQMNHFSPVFFESLMKHAVPLNLAAVARLSHNAMALDGYTWLANRLHRVDPNKPAFVPWVAETKGLV